MLMSTAGEPSDEEVSRYEICVPSFIFITMAPFGLTFMLSPRFVARRKNSFAVVTGALLSILRTEVFPLPLTPK